jgi:hypothetical protein
LFFLLLTITVLVVIIAQSSSVRNGNVPLTMTFDEVKAQGTWHQENDFHSKLGQPDNCAKEEEDAMEEGRGGVGIASAAKSECWSQHAIVAQASNNVGLQTRLGQASLLA